MKFKRVSRCGREKILTELESGFERCTPQKQSEDMAKEMLRFITQE